MTKGWNEELGAFYGSDALDAANPMVVLTMSCAPGEPRINGTVDAILRPLDQGRLLSNNLV